MPPVARTASDRRSVLLLLLLLALGILGLAISGVRATVRDARGKERTAGALSRAALEQWEFHGRQGRFALWRELESGGARLPPAMSVDTSTATPSHWYLRLHDSASGLLCDRIGTIVDEPTERVAPTCRPAPR